MDGDYYIMDGDYDAMATDFMNIAGEYRHDVIERDILKILEYLSDASKIIYYHELALSFDTIEDMSNRLKEHLVEQLWDIMFQSHSELLQSVDSLLQFLISTRHHVYKLITRESSSSDSTSTLSGEINEDENTPPPTKSKMRIQNSANTTPNSKMCNSMQPNSHANQQSRLEGLCNGRFRIEYV